MHPGTASTCSIATISSTKTTSTSSHCCFRHLLLTRISMLVALNVTNLEKWGYTNSTLFIDPKQPEFQARDFNSDDFTDEAINNRIAWLYSTNPYNKGNVSAVYAALDAPS